MSLKGKLISSIGGKVAESILSSEIINNAVNKVSEKAAEKSGYKNIPEYMKNIRSKNYLVIKTRSFSLGTGLAATASILAGKVPNISGDMISYKIYDSNNELKYKSDDESAYMLVDFDRELLSLYDLDNKKIGTVKEWIISVGIPLFEKDVKKCTIKYGNKKICDLKKYVSFGDLEFESLEGDVEIETDGSDKAFTIEYNSKKRLFCTSGR